MPQDSPPPASTAPRGRSPAPKSRGFGFGSLSRPKSIAIVVGGVILLLAVLVIAPNIPQQMRRSGAFQAMADGDYETAALELEIYVKERPNDAEAGLQYALAALHSGNLPAAQAAFDKYAGSPLAQQEENTLGRALAQLGKPDAAFPLLNSLVSRNSGNAAAHLARGVLRASQGDLRRAREDLLQADDIIRGYVEENHFLPLTHKILLQTAAAREITAPTPPPKSPAPVEGRIGFPLGAVGFASQYALPADYEFLGESVPQSAIPALHYANMLIDAGQYQEAETELSQAASLAPDLLLAENLKAFLFLRQGEFAKAAAKFSDVVARAPSSPRALLNLANAQWSENPDPVRWESAAAAYDGVLAGNPGIPEASLALNNRGHIRTFGGNLKGAAEDFTAAIDMLKSDQSESAKKLSQRARFNLAIVNMAEGGRHIEVLDALERLAEERFPSASRALVAAAQIAILPDRAMRYDEAFAASGDLEPLLASALYYERRGLLLRALWTLDQLNPSPDIREILNFRRGRILVKLQNPEAANEQLNDIKDPRRAAVLRAIIAAASGDADEALSLYRRGVSENPESPVTYAEQAEYGESLGEWLAPQWPVPSDFQGFQADYYPRLAALLSRTVVKNDPEEAVRLANLAVRVWPNDFLVLRHAGIVLGETGDHQAGLALLERALEGYPADREILKSVQNFRSEIGDREGSLRAAETLFNMTNTNQERETGFKMLDVAKDVVEGLQKALRKRDYERALEIYDLALASAKTEDNRNALLFHRAAVLRASGRLRAAILSLDEVLISGALSNLDRAAALAARGRNLITDGRNSEAEDDFREAAQLDPANANYLRRAALASSDPAAGLEEAIRRFPLDEQAYWDLADNYRKAGQFLKVIAVMRRMARVTPVHPDIYKLLGDIQTAAGYNRDAVVNQQIYDALSGGV